ncbi:hypothetical protein NPIL_279611, partial [Nephila pilipes]
LENREEDFEQYIVPYNYYVGRKKLLKREINDSQLDTNDKFQKVFKEGQISPLYLSGGYNIPESDDEE